LKTLPALIVSRNAYAWRFAMTLHHLIVTLKTLKRESGKIAVAVT